MAEIIVIIKVEKDVIAYDEVSICRGYSLVIAPRRRLGLVQFLLRWLNTSPHQRHRQMDMHLFRCSGHSVCGIVEVLR